MQNRQGGQDEEDRRGRKDPKNRRKILIVDDSPSSVAIMERVLGDTYHLARINDTLRTEIAERR